MHVEVTIAVKGQLTNPLGRLPFDAAPQASDALTLPVSNVISDQKLILNVEN